RARSGGREAAVSRDQFQRGRLPAGLRRQRRHARAGRRDRAAVDARQRARARPARGPPPRGAGTAARRMKIPLVYNVRSVLQRPVSTAFTALGIALVVAVFIGMLALANGFRTALVRTGSDRNVLVLRRGADSELSSGLSREVASILAAAPHIATGADAKPLVSPEVYVLIPLPKIFDTTQVANVVARGIGDQAWTVRSNVGVLEGRKPQTGRSEICVGRRLVARFPHTGIGETMRLAGGTGRWCVT